MREQPVLAGGIEALLRIVRCLGPESTIALRFSVMSAQTAASSPDLVRPTEACLWQTLAGADVAALAASFIAEIAPDASPGSTTLADEFFDRVLECLSVVASPPEVTPRPAPVPTQEEFASASAGESYTCGVRNDASVIWWGEAVGSGVAIGCRLSSHPAAAIIRRINT